jgi:hypothetical protein
LQSSTSSTWRLCCGTGEGEGLLVLMCSSIRVVTNQRMIFTLPYGVSHVG